MTQLDEHIFQMAWFNHQTRKDVWKGETFGVIFWLEESLESQGWFPNGLGFFFLVHRVELFVFLRRTKDMVI